MGTEYLRYNRPKWIGQPLRRFEDRRLVSGAGRYVDDLNPAACLHLEFVRSSFAAGRIVRLNLDAARAAEGVEAIFTGQELDGLGTIAVNSLVPDIRIPEFSALARDHVKSVGQPVAAIVACSPMMAKDAAQLVFVDIQQGNSDDRQHPSGFSESWTAGDVEAAFRTAAHVVSVKIRQPRVAPMALEPRATLANWDGADSVLTVWLGTQTPHRARIDLARILGLNERQVRVITQDVGGAFGGKASIYPEDIVVAFASMRLGMPVKWCATRSEDMLSATHGRGARSEGELALSAEGLFLGLRAKLDFPLGYWLPYSAAAPAHNAGRILPGPYKVNSFDIQVCATVSNTAPVNIYRGAGRPEAAMLMERLIDGAARALTVDPADIRLRNLIPPEAMPFSSPTGSLLDSGDYPALLKKACKTSDYARLLELRARRREEGAICGVGIGFYVEPCGQGWESASVHLEADGTIVVASGSSAQGQGRDTAFAQIAADALYVAPDEIIIRHSDTAHAPAGIGALASRSTAIGGSAVRVACDKFRKEAQVIAARLLNLDVDRVSLSFGGYEDIADGARRVSWKDIADHIFADSSSSSPLKVSETFHADGEAWSSGCCVAMVAIDPDTGELGITHLTWIDDAGIVVNPLLVEGQLVGGMAQGLGEALMEEIVYDEDGQLLTGSISDYAVPRASHIPPIQLGKLETPSTANALGAKGVGEAGCIGIPAAIANATVDALSPFGVAHIDMPFTSAKIWHAMNGYPRTKIEG